MAFKAAVLLLLLAVGCVTGFGNDRVLLRDVSAITLQAGTMTAGRRSAPVAQLRCVGGCSSYAPSAVQCLNRGHDGSDVQWECKADMDSSYRFGSISVSCEGYDYPDDPYVLRGSCGLEYSLVGSGGAGTGGWKANNPLPTGNGNGSGVLVILVLIGVAFVVYKLFLSGGTTGQGTPYPPADDVHQQNAFGLGSGPAYPPPPPPYSFKNDNPNPGFTAGTAPPPSYGWSAPGEPRMRRPADQASSGPGFWSGMGTGGLMGYLLGSRNSGSTYHHQQAHHHQPAHNPSWFGRSSSSSSASTVGGRGGTRTTSGFGGTTRR